MTDETPVAGRRRRRRSSRGGFSTGGLSDSSRAEGAELDADLEDDMENPLNEEVIRQAAVLSSSQPPQEEALSDPTTELEEEFTPGNRMRDVGKRSSKYEKEYRYKLLHRMLLRNVPLDKIADELNLSVSQVRRDRASLYARIREEAKSLDINMLVGDSVGFYNEIMSMALRAASLNKTPLNMRLAAMRTSLSAKNDMHRFLQASGVYDVLKYKAAEEGSSDGDISKMVKLTKMMLEMDIEGELPDEGIQIPKDELKDQMGYDDEEEDDIVRVLQ
jgi:hypothetical protein